MRVRAGSEIDGWGGEAEMATWYWTCCLRCKNVRALDFVCEYHQAALFRLRDRNMVIHMIRGSVCLHLTILVFCLTEVPAISYRT